MDKIKYKRLLRSILSTDDYISAVNNLDDLINSVKEECAKKADLVQNPYPESVFPMDTEGYVRAIPDEHLRTAISGYCGRIFFDIAKKEIVKAIIDSKEK